MTSLAAQVAKKPDKIYDCTECNAIFLFKSDVEKHGRQTNHDKMNTLPFGELHGRVYFQVCNAVNYKANLLLY